MITGTQWLTMASKRRLEDGVSPAMFRQNLDKAMPWLDCLIPLLLMLPNVKCTSFSSLRR